MLESPSHFDWAKKLLLSSLPSMFQQHGETLLNNDQSTTPIKKRARRIGGQSPIVESEVRHSLRVKEKCQDFKQSQCSKVSCLGCSLNPPTLSPKLMKLSPKLMKSIGTTICQIDPSKLEEGILSKKRRQSP